MTGIDLAIEQLEDLLDLRLSYIQKADVERVLEELKDELLDLHGLKEADANYDEGYYDEGHAEGYATGHKEGYDEGYDEGYEKGCRDSERVA